MFVKTTKRRKAPVGVNHDKKKVGEGSAAAYFHASIGHHPRREKRKRSKKEGGGRHATGKR